MPNPAPGQLQLHWIKAQTTYDTIAAYAATDAVSGIIDTFKIDGEKGFEELNEAVGTASHQGSIATTRGGKFSGSFLVKPAAAGTPPDIGPALIKGAMGVETINAGTSVVYTLSDTVKTPLQGCLNIASNLQHIFSGGVIEEMTIEISGNGMPTVSFSGSFATFGHCYADVNKSAEPQAETTIALDNASIGCVSPGAVIGFEDDNNSDAGYTVTAVDWTAGAANFTITPGIAGAPGIGAGEALFPLVPSQTVGGTAIAAVACGFTIDSQALGFIKATIKLTTGWGLRDKEASSDRALGIVRTGKRMVTGSVDFYFLDSATGNAPNLGRSWDSTTVRDLFLRVGADTAAARMKIDLNKCLCKPPAFNIGGDVVTASMAFDAQQNAAAADEMIVTFD